jgi:hypothetical protein
MTKPPLGMLEEEEPSGVLEEEESPPISPRSHQMKPHFGMREEAERCGELPTSWRSE